MNITDLITRIDNYFPGVGSDSNETNPQKDDINCELIVEITHELDQYHQDDLPEILGLVLRFVLCNRPTCLVDAYKYERLIYFLDLNTDICYIKNNFKDYTDEEIFHRIRFRKLIQEKFKSFNNIQLIIICDWLAEIISWDVFEAMNNDIKSGLHYWRNLVKEIETSCDKR